MSAILNSLRSTLILLVAFTLLCCGAYPLAITAVSKTLFQRQSNGSLLGDKSGAIVGSELIGQNFSKPGYFWGRPSATADMPYNSNASSGSNLGVNNPALVDSVKTRLSALASVGSLVTPVPVDLVTASASGLDPDISPAAALYQAARIAKARNISEDAVLSAISFATEGRTFGILGEPRVNVLKANLKLDGRLD